MATNRLREKLSLSLARSLSWSYTFSSCEPVARLHKATSAPATTKTPTATLNLAQANGERAALNQSHLRTHKLSLASRIGAQPVELRQGADSGESESVSSEREPSDSAMPEPFRRLLRRQLKGRRRCALSLHLCMRHLLALFVELGQSISRVAPIGCQIERSNQITGRNKSPVAAD